MELLGSAVARYAERFHATLDIKHQVTSPLGAWLVLALVAPAATGSRRQELEAVLGVPAAAAAAHAAELLTDPHPAVAAAAAIWIRDEYRTPALDAWEAGLAAAVERGDIPTQAAADAWAAARTKQLIEKFPLDLDDDTVLVLSSALATDVSWARPFDLADGTELGWPVERVLRTPDPHQGFLATDLDAGDVAVHTANSVEGVDVISVIAAPETAPTTVLAAAHRLALDPRTTRRSLFDLPLGEGHAWTLTEEPVRTVNQDGREEHHPALLPAWSGKSRHELDAPATGFPAAGAALKPLLSWPDSALDSEGVQVAMARYTRVGFQAAAVTSIGVRAVSMPPPPRPGVRRTALLRFGRPYAVVAVVTHRDHRLPVFAAWVAAADEVPADPF